MRAERQTDSRKLIVVLGFFNVLTALGLGRFLFSLFVPHLHGAYLFSYTQIGMIGGLLISGYLVFSYLGGVASHRFGETTVVLVSLVVISMAFIVFYLEDRFLPLCVFAFLMGAAAASLYVSIFQTVHGHFEEATYGRRMGLIISGAGCGIFLLSALALLLSRGSIAFDMRHIWVAAAVIGGLLIPAHALLARRVRAAGGGSSGETGRVRYARIWQRLFSEPPYRNITLAYLLFGFSYASYLTYIVAFATEVGGERVSVAVWGLFGVTSAFSSALWGAWFDRSRTGAILYYNYALIALALLLPVVAPSVLAAGISAALFGLCFFGYLTVFGGIVMRRTRELSSVYMGKITLVHAAGQVAGVYVGGVLRDATASFRMPFLLALLVTAGSLVFFSMGIAREGREEVAALTNTEAADEY